MIDLNFKTVKKNHEEIRNIKADTVKRKKNNNNNR